MSGGALFNFPLEMFDCLHIYSFFLVFYVFFLQISDDGRYVVLSITEGCEPVNQLWYCDLQQLQHGITGL